MGEPAEEHRLVQARLDKIAALRERGIDPYPPRYRRSHTIARARDLFIEAEDAARKSGGEDTDLSAVRTEPVQIAGRLMARRGMGKASFVDLSNGLDRIQAHIRSDTLGDEYELLDLLDIGDFVGISGPLFRTRRGEISVEARELTVLSKAIRPLPDKWAGLQDTEIRFRQRYLDLIANEKAMRNAVMRSEVVASMRRFMHERGFIEVETPVLVPVAAGAMARPFQTHHNALNRRLYLRIATELYLKKLIVGGFEKVFEIGRLFRNEGIDQEHNPEFTTIESYEAYADYNDVMEMVEQMVSTIARDSDSTSRASRKSMPHRSMISCLRSTRRHGGDRSTSGPSSPAGFTTAEPVTSRAMVDTICSTICITSL